MAKKFQDQVMKFEITKSKIKMEISLKDLVWLFENSPNNYGYDGEGIAKVKRGKRQEFAEYVVKQLLDQSNLSVGECSEDPKWGVPFEEIFEEICEGAEDEFIKYPNDDEDC